MKKFLMATILFSFSSIAFSASEYCLSDVCLFDTIDKFKFDGVKWQHVVWLPYPICDVSAALASAQHDTPDGKSADVGFQYVLGAPKGSHFRVTSISVNLPSGITKEQGEELLKNLVKRMGLKLLKRDASTFGFPFYGAKIDGGTVTLDVYHQGHQSLFGVPYAELQFIPDNANRAKWEKRLHSQPGCNKVSLPKL